jgi:hypothetical protein
MTEGSEFKSRQDQKSFFLYFAHTGSEAHPVFYTMVQRVRGSILPGGKWLGREVHHSISSAAEVKKTWIYTSTPHYGLMA